MKRGIETSLDRAVVDVWGREIGALSTRSFSRRLAASKDIVLGLDIDKKIRESFVKPISFSDDGDVLVSGSKRIILWDWKTGEDRFSFPYQHSRLLQAKIMPYTDNRTIISTTDNLQVQLNQILERGVGTSVLANLRVGATGLAIEPGSPYIFYISDLDGLVQHFDLRTRIATELFTERRKLWFTRNNAIAIDPRDPNYLVVAGLDEYTRVYDIRKYKRNGSIDIGKPVNFFCPPDLGGDHHTGITGLDLSDQGELLVAYSNDCNYLFTREMGLGSEFVPAPPKYTEGNPSKVIGSLSAATSDSDEKLYPQVYKGQWHCTLERGVSFFGPKCEYVVSGSERGRMFIWSKKGGELIRVVDAPGIAASCLDAHPHAPVLASSGFGHIKIWTPKAIDD